MCNVPLPQPPAPSTSAKLPPLYVVLTSPRERAAWKPLVTTGQVAGVVTRRSLSAGEFESAIAAGKSLTFNQCYEWFLPAVQAEP